MSYRTTRRARRSSVALSTFTLLAAASTAAAAPVDLGTSAAFVVLGGSTVTNTGPSTLNGDLGLSPGTALSGFGLPAVVNGASHANDAVAAQAQADASTAYGVAAGQPVAPGDVLTGTDLGNRTLQPGAYRYATSAQLTGALTLDGGGDPGAQFVFQIGSTLTTASASSVVLLNGASACNIFWQIGSSATLGTGTAFQGNLLASTAITLNTGASIVGRAIASTAAVTLDDNVLTAPACTTPGVVPTPTVGAGAGGTATGGDSGTSAASGGTAGSSNSTGSGSSNGSNANDSSSTTRTGTATFRRVTGRRCAAPFRARARGTAIARVRFHLDGRLVATRTRAPYTVAVDAGAGRHRVEALVSFTDGTPIARFQLGYRACAKAALAPRRGPSAFTG